MNPEILNAGRDYVLGWGTLMLINAVLAQGKNRNGLNWFLISFFDLKSKISKTAKNETFFLRFCFFGYLPKS